MKKIISFILLLPLLFSRCQKETGEAYILKLYGDVFEDIGYSVAIASDGYIIAGQTADIKRENGLVVEGSANRNMTVIKTDWNGNLKWKTSLGGKNEDSGSRIYQLNDGSLLCVGTFTDTSAVTGYKSEVLLVKLSPAGEILWQKTYGEKGNQTGKDIIEASFGYIIIGTTDIENPPVTASTGNPEGKTDILILRTNHNGKLIEPDSIQQRGYPGNESASAIKRDGSGYIILATTETPSNPIKKHDLFFIKLNEQGLVIDQKVTGTNDDEYSSDLEVLDDGYLVSATIGAAGSEQQGYILRLNTDIHSAPVYEKKIQVDNMSTSFNSVCSYKQGNFAIAGSIGSGLSSKMLVIETDGSGNLVEGSKMIRGSNGQQVVNDIVSGDDGYLIAVGSNKYDLNSMITFLKFKF